VDILLFIWLSSLPIDLGLPGQYTAPNKYSNNDKNIFIVHGHDEESKLTLSNLLYDLGLKPLVLHDMPNQGRTIIEKFERNAGLAKYAFILLTPDDIGGKNAQNLNSRARQNVIFELGFFIGALGRDRVCCIYRKGVELPSDIDGLVYLPYAQSVRECDMGIMRELKDAGYSIKL
jgi:predicted nucleotide-binding protein